MTFEGGKGVAQDRDQPDRIGPDSASAFPRRSVRWSVRWPVHCSGFRPQPMHQGKSAGQRNVTGGSNPIVPGVSVSLLRRRQTPFKPRCPLLLCRYNR